MDPRIQAEIEMFRRMMEEAALALAPGMPLDARREYILNCLMTKVSVFVSLRNRAEIQSHEVKNTNQHVIIISGERMISGETKERIPNRKDDVVLDQFHDNESDDDPTTACAICLSEYEDGDEISWSHHPNCSHFFHRSCIAEWLLSHDECPCCRLDFLSFDNDDDDERADDIESGSRESPTAPIRMENADADFARSMQLFFEMVANGRPRTMYSRNNNESRATLTPLQRPFGT